MKNVIQPTLLIFIVIGLFISCKKDKDQVATPIPPANEEEIITTFKLIFTDSAGTSPAVTAQFRDPDGTGGNPFLQFDTIKLSANKTYMATALILDETKSPTDTVSAEIEEEANDHLFFYTPTGMNTVITILDQDTHNPPLPLGIQTKWKTTTAGSGMVQIVLRHQPGVKDGTYTPGETDIDLSFQIKIE